MPFIRRWSTCSGTRISSDLPRSRPCWSPRYRYYYYYYYRVDPSYRPEGVNTRYIEYPAVPVLAAQPFRRVPQRGVEAVACGWSRSGHQGRRNSRAGFGSVRPPGGALRPTRSRPCPADGAIDTAIASLSARNWQKVADETIEICREVRSPKAVGRESRSG